MTPELRTNPELQQHITELLERQPLLTSREMAEQLDAAIEDVAWEIVVMAQHGHVTFDGGRPARYRLNTRKPAVTSAHQASAFEWLRYLPDRVGQRINQRDALQAEVALRAWHQAGTEPAHSTVRADSLTSKKHAWLPEDGDPVTEQAARALCRDIWGEDASLPDGSDSIHLRNARIAIAHWRQCQAAMDAIDPGDAR